MVRTRSQARALQVGEPSCRATPDLDDRYFGSINFPWGGNDLEDLAQEHRPGGLQSAHHAQQAYPPATLPGDNQCQNLTGAGSVISTDTVSMANTNCLQTVTGLKATDAYDGYLDNGRQAHRRHQSRPAQRWADPSRADPGRPASR